MKVFVYFITTYFFIFNSIININYIYAGTKRGVFLKNTISEEKKKFLMKQPGIFYKNSWAVIIGINNYYRWPKLRYACNDARGFLNVLIKEYGFKRENITYLIDVPQSGETADALPTLKNIKSSFEKLFDNTKVTKNDRVIVFFAGHGQTYTLPEGGEMGYLIPIDAKISKKKLYSTAISMNDIKVLSKSIPAKHILYLIDSCYSGLAANNYRGLPPDVEDFINKITRKPGRAIITAGQEGEQVVENSDWGHSAFAYKLIEGLKYGDADSNKDFVITSTELGNYLKNEVTVFSDFKQTPQYRFLEGEGELVFVRPEIFNDFDLFISDNTDKTFDNIIVFFQNHPEIPESIQKSLLTKLEKYEKESTPPQKASTEKPAEIKLLSSSPEIKKEVIIPKIQKKKKSIFKKWWFWLIIAGAGVAAAAAGGGDDNGGNDATTGSITASW